MIPFCINDTNCIPLYNVNTSKRSSRCCKDLGVVDLDCVLKYRLMMRFLTYVAASSFQCQNHSPLQHSIMLK